MNSRKLMVGLLSSTALTLAWGSMNVADAAPCTTAYVIGDVFASIGSGSADVYTPTGTLVCSLSDGSGGFTTGSGFDSAGNYYLTNFGPTVSKFNDTGGLVASSFISGGSVGTKESIVNVSTGAFAGSSFVGGPGSASIDQFNTATGALIHSFSVTGGNGTGGTDWLDFISPTTVIYDGEGSVIREFNLATNTQMADFASTGLNRIFAMRVIASGAFAGDVLVADSSDAKLLDASGHVIKTYTLPGDSGLDFSLNLDPNGTDFWTGDASSRNIWEVNIATGAIDNQFLTTGEFYGLTVFGEITTSNGGGGGSVPEPTTLALFGAGLVGLGMMRRRRAS